MSVEFTDKRFGVIAIEKGFITMNQLVECLTIQIEEEIERGVHRIIGAILVEKGYLNLLQVEEILEAME
jgi:hypothetical protein